MRISKASFALVVGILVSSASLAHEDRVLSIGEDGTMADVPPEYGPAKLIVDFSSTNSNAPPVQSIALSLGKKLTHLPVCVTGLLQSRSMNEVMASGSWYHNESRLPYYISIMFLDPGHNPASWNNPGYSLLFNLRTGKLIKMEVHIARRHGRSVQHVPVDLTERCSPNVFRTFTDAAI